LKSREEKKGGVSWEETGGVVGESQVYCPKVSDGGRLEPTLSQGNTQELRDMWGKFVNSLSDGRVKKGLKSEKGAWERR